MTHDISPEQARMHPADLIFRQALALHQAGKLQAAEKLYREILLTQPDHTEANHSLGVLALQNQQPAASLPYFMTALDADPANGKFWISYIDALCQAGQLDDARQVLTLARQHGLEGDDVDALALHLNTDATSSHAQVPPAQAPASTHRAKKQTGKSGKTSRQQARAPGTEEINAIVALFNQGQLHEVVSRARIMTEQYPHHPIGWKALGVALNQLGRAREALLPMQKTAAFAPQDAEAHNNLGIVLNTLKRFDEAETSYRAAIKINPGYAQAHSNLGANLQDQRRLEEAESSYRKALQINPDYAKARNNLGAALHELRRLEEAEACYRHILQYNPDYADAHRNLGTTLHDLDRLAEAEASYRRALQLNPQDADAYSYLGITLRDSGQLAEAESSLRRALELNPGSADAHYNLSHALLMTGQLAEGWQQYEYRWDATAIKTMQRPATRLTQWTGQEHPATDRLLVFKEQGMGDQIQFSRYLPLVSKRFAAVSMVTTPPLLSLFRRSFPQAEILETIPTEQTAWQWQAPLLSLPLAMDTQLDTIPDQTPYLITDPVKVAHWHSRIAALALPAGSRNIGLVWKPGSLMKNAALRALTLQQLAPLLKLSHCNWFSLQKEADADKAPWVAAGSLIDWSDDFDDFDDTAALLENLDLVISVDTAVAHLAGALGQPTWLLNRHAGEWRWLHNRMDSPWYPGMRIFTQQQAGNWDEVVQQVVMALQHTPT